MENIKHIGIIVHRQEDLWQGTRTALGLAVGNFYAYLFLLDEEVRPTEKLTGNLEWLDDMECECWSNIPANEIHGFTYMSTKKIAKKLKEMDIVIPFGNRIDAPPGHLPITWMMEPMSGAGV